MLKFWKKPDPTTALNAKIEVLETINAGLMADAESLLAANAELQSAMIGADKTANMYRRLHQEVSALNATLQAKLDRRNANLKQFRKAVNDDRSVADLIPTQRPAAEVGGVFVTSGISLADEAVSDAGECTPIIDECVTTATVAGTQVRVGTCETWAG